MGKPRQKQTYSPELIENLRFRFEETGEPVRTIAVSVPMARTTLYALAQERGWTRFVRPPLDLTPAARLAAEAGKLAAEAGRPAAENLSRRPEVPSRSDGLEGPVTQRPFEARLRRAPQGDGADELSPPSPDPAPPLEEPAGGVEQEADVSNLEPQERRARLSGMARLIDHQLALLHRRQALPQTEHERKEISIEAAKLNAALSQTEHQLQDLDRGHNARTAIAGDDSRTMDIDERRLLLAQRIREFARSRRGGEDDAAADAPAG